MLAVAGILTNDLLSLSEKWWIPDNSDHLAPGTEYPGGVRTLVEIAVMAVAESFRIQAFTKEGPGAKAFDPANMNSAEAKLKEIKNGRLAMIAFLGFTSQAAVRGLGPLECLKLHLSAPAQNNIFTSAVGNEATVAVVALAVAPIIIRFFKEKAGDDDEFRPVRCRWRIPVPCCFFGPWFRAGVFSRACSPRAAADPVVSSSPVEGWRLLPAFRERSLVVCGGVQACYSGRRLPQKLRRCICKYILRSRFFFGGPGSASVSCNHNL